MDVVIAGGGLAGLVAARRLAEAGAAVTLYEARDGVGGRVRSTRADGFTLDRGFQVLFDAYPSARRELDLEALDLRRFAPGATIARPGHRSTLADPLRNPGAAVETLFNADVAVGDLWRLWRLRRDLRGLDEAEIFGSVGGDVAGYLRARGFSDAFVENFAAPFYGGITLDRSLSTAAPVFAYTFKMLAEGRAAVPAGGMGAIPAQLRRRAEAAGATVETGAEVSVVAPEGANAVVEAGGKTRLVDAAVVATDPATAGELTGVDTPTETRGCTTVHLSVPDYEALDTGTRILLNAADARPNTVAPMSAVAPEYAPEDRELLSATFLGVPDERRPSSPRSHAREDDAALGEAAADALRSWYPEHRLGDVEVRRVDSVPFAQFAQPPGFLDDRPSIYAPDGPVFLAGDYTRWSSIHGALESGRVAAEAVLES